MARFYFDTKVRSRLVRDTAGLEFASERQALDFAHASTAAFAEERIRRNESLDHLQKIVRDETGRVVETFTFAEALRRFAVQP